MAVTSLRTLTLWTLTVALLVANANLFLQPQHGLALPASEEVYTYYGQVPPRLYNNWTFHADMHQANWTGEWWRLESIRREGFVGVLGNEDGTRIRVYSLPDKSLVMEATVNRFEWVTATLPNGSFFKVTTDKPATVMLLGSNQTIQGPYSTFFTSTSGRYADKEFVFPYLMPTLWTAAWGDLPYKLFALEDSEVTIWDRNGSKAAEFKLQANRVEQLSLKAGEAYRLVSTGNVMLQSFWAGTCFYPAVEGGFLGERFHGASMRTEYWGVSATYQTQPSFTLTGMAESRITVADIENRRKYADMSVAAKSNLSTQITTTEIVVESEKPLLFLYENSGITFVGLAADETVYMEVPVGEAYIFAQTATNLQLDDVRLRLDQDRIQPLPRGYHTLSADQNILIEVVNLTDDQGFTGFGSCIPSVESISEVNQGLTLKPPIPEELPWTYVVAAAVIVAVCLIVVLRLRSRRPGSGKSPGS